SSTKHIATTPSDGADEPLMGATTADSQPRFPFHPFASLALAKWKPMKWSFLKNCWPLSHREARGSRWPKLRAARPRAPLLLEELEGRVAPSFSLGAAANYAILYEGGNRGLLSISNSFTNTTGTGPGQGGGIGNIGVGGSGFVGVTGNGSVNGNIDFSASNT